MLIIVIIFLIANVACVLGSRFRYLSFAVIHSSVQKEVADDPALLSTLRFKSIGGNVKTSEETEKRLQVYDLYSGISTEIRDAHVRLFSKLLDSGESHETDGSIIDNYKNEIFEAFAAKVNLPHIQGKCTLTLQHLQLLRALCIEHCNRTLVEALIPGYDDELRVDLQGKLEDLSAELLVIEDEYRDRVNYPIVASNDEDSAAPAVLPELQSAWPTPLTFLRSTCIRIMSRIDKIVATRAPPRVHKWLKNNGVWVVAQGGLFVVNLLQGELSRRQAAYQCERRLAEVPEFPLL